MRSPSSPDPTTAAAADDEEEDIVFLPVWNDRRKKERPRRGSGGGGGGDFDHDRERGWEDAVGRVGGGAEQSEGPPPHRLSSDHEPPLEALGVKVSYRYVFTAWDSRRKHTANFFSPA